jgi:hypothetical protein
VVSIAYYLSSLIWLTIARKQFIDHIQGSFRLLV